MEVILLERVAKLGQMGETVRVKDGFARNFLLAKGKALRATKENKARFEVMRKDLEAKNLENRGEAEKVSGKLDGKTFVVIRQASETGQLFGSVTTRDIAMIDRRGGIEVTRNQIHAPRADQDDRRHKVPVALHPEVEVMIAVNVARNEEEAERIARGEDVTVRRTAAEEEKAQAAANAEAFFEEGAKHDDVDGGEEKAEGEEGEEGLKFASLPSWSRSRASSLAGPRLRTRGRAPHDEGSLQRDFLHVGRRGLRPLFGQRGMRAGGIARRTAGLRPAPAPPQARRFAVSTGFAVRRLRLRGLAFPPA